LKAAREASGWTIDHVADQLKLAPRQVLALEEGDFASLPNLAVVRGFVRAYAKVLKLDPVPLVALIEVNPVASAEATPARREISTTFSEARFPSMMSKRSNNASAWIIGAALVALLAAAGAYKLGYISPAMLNHAEKDVRAVGAAASASASTPASASAGVSAAVETTLVKPGQELTPLQSTSVPLISVPPVAGTTATPAPAAAAEVKPGTAAELKPAELKPAAVAAGANALVLTLSQDSWIEIRRPGAAPLISRVVKAGSTETFDIEGPALLIVGKPAGVDATLRGAKLTLTPTAGGTTSRLNIK